MSEKTAKPKFMVCSLHVSPEVEFWVRGSSSLALSLLLPPLSVSVCQFSVFSHAPHSWTEQRMNLGSSSWVRQLLVDCLRSAQSLSLSSVKLWYETLQSSTTGTPTLEKINAGQSPWKHHGGELGVFSVHKEQEEWCNEERAITTDSSCVNVCLACLPHVSLVSLAAISETYTL